MKGKGQGRSTEFFEVSGTLCSAHRPVEWMISKVGPLFELVIERMDGDPAGGGKRARYRTGGGSIRQAAQFIHVRRSHLASVATSANQDLGLALETLLCASGIINDRRVQCCAVDLERRTGMSSCGNESECRTGRYQTRGQCTVDGRGMTSLVRKRAWMKDLGSVVAGLATGLTKEKTR